MSTLRDKQIALETEIGSLGVSNYFKNLEKRGQAENRVGAALLENSIQPLLTKLEEFCESTRGGIGTLPYREGKPLPDRPLDIENLIEELGDLEFYMEGLRQGVGITREEVLTRNIDKLTIRYGNSYSDEAAKARVDML